MSETKIYKILIELCDDRLVDKPPVWRTLEIPESYNFFDLHVAIQDAMIWSDVELHRFDMRNPTTMEMDYIGIEDDLMCEPIVCEKDALIADYFSLTNNECIYLYNFLTPWTLRIVLEKILLAIPNIKYPRCIDGNGMAPEVFGETDGENFDWDNLEFDLKNIEFRDPEEAWLDAYQGF